MNPAQRSYVLLTAAHNEECYLERTLQSVAAQTEPPAKWVVVNDRSTDRTQEIIESFAGRYRFIEPVQMNETGGHDFAAKVRALRAAYQRLTGAAYDYIGILDGDISLDPGYYSRLLDKFEQDPSLGLAGGFIYEEHDGSFRSRKTNSSSSVAGGIQMFRRQCYEAVGGLQPMPYGGEDWCAEIRSRMLGWKVHAFAELRALHHRHTGKGGGLLRYWYRQGKMDFGMGSVPAFEVVKCLRRTADNPIILGAMARLAGFSLSYFAHNPYPMPPEFLAYVRKKQYQRLRAMFQIDTLREWLREKRNLAEPRSSYKGD